MKKTFYFSTGVKFGTNPYLDEKAVMSPNGVMLLPFACEGVPEKASFAFACDNPKIKGHESFIVKPIVGESLLLSKYAYFKP